MKIICCGCKKDMGEKEGPKNSVSHSYCDICKEIAQSLPPTTILEYYELGKKISEDITYMPREKLAVLLRLQREQNRTVKYQIKELTNVL